ncbi:MAG: ABC transporter substrate-binding protein [Verrucomicrobia bacterium]|nr:ABC transporter substrate-binding protein [Verrucomicrobiota bacterium]
MKRLTTFALFLAFAGAAFAESPLAKVKTTTEKVLLLLQDSKFQGEEKKSERRSLVRAEMEKRFAWEESARACLGRHWIKRTPAEKAEFVKLFSEFLKDTYSDKVATYYGDLEKVDYQGEKIQADYASVKLVLKTKAKIDHPLEYRMEKTGDDWKVYDVVIEGVSMVKNYRDQFDAIIAKSSYEGLIKEIRAKQPTP